MSISLVDALEDVELEAGQTYRCEVRGHHVELRVLTAQALRDESTGLIESDVMLDPWCELPKPPAVGRITSRRVERLPFDIPHIPAEGDVT